jgi:hypothetical protein
MPYYCLYTDILNPHVYESYRQVIRRARSYLKDRDRRAPEMREMRKAFYRAVTFHHFQARRFVVSIGGL